MKKTLFLVAIAILLISCAANVTNVQLKRRIYNEPQQNEIITKEIGEKLILQGEEDYQDAIKITSIPNAIRLYNTNFPYYSGKILPLSGETSEYKLFFDPKDKHDQYYQGNKGEYYYGIAIRKSDGKAMVFLNSIIGALGGLKTKDIDDLSVENATYTDDNCKNCFKQEFVFNGKVDNNLKFIYREYTENMARPAFTQELQYDQKDSNVIGFKGMRLEVIKASNTSIEYKIINSFTK